MIINKRKKKKGFTLIELIAVIAILAILGAILVPKIGGYSQKATNAKVQADAKIVLTGISAYNAENAGTAIASLDAAAKTLLVPYCDVPGYLVQTPTALTIAKVEIIASGDTTKFTASKTASAYTVVVP